MPNPASPIVVYGASGHTGRFVAEELRRRGRPLVLAGRDGTKLAAMARDGEVVRAADIADPRALDEALAGAAAVINCAGPFLDTAAPVIEAALRAGAHYLDVTAEQASARDTLDRFDGPARTAGVAVTPGVAFYGGLGDLMASLAVGDWPGADEVRIAIALDSWLPTEGTRATGRRNTFTRQVIRDGALRDIETPPAETSWTFPPPFGAQAMVELPFTETILVGRHLKIGELRNLFSTAPLGDLRDPDTPPPVVDPVTGRSGQTFVVECVARRGEAARRIRVSGEDIYASTAPLVVEVAERMLAGEPSGALTPAEVTDPAAVLRALSAHGFVTEGPLA